MNNLQFQDLAEMKRLVKECTHIDLLIRVNGENRMIEADFLKPLILALPLLSPATVREMNLKNVKFECGAGSSSGTSHPDLVGGAGTSRYIDIKPYKDK